MHKSPFLFFSEAREAGFAFMESTSFGIEVDSYYGSEWVEWVHVGQRRCIHVIEGRFRRSRWYLELSSHDASAWFSASSWLTMVGDVEPNLAPQDQARMVRMTVDMLDAVDVDELARRDAGRTAANEFSASEAFRRGSPELSGLRHVVDGFRQAIADRGIEFRSRSGVMLTAVDASLQLDDDLDLAWAALTLSDGDVLHLPIHPTTPADEAIAHLQQQPVAELNQVAAWLRTLAPPWRHTTPRDHGYVVS